MNSGQWQDLFFRTSVVLLITLIAVATVAFIVWAVRRAHS
jgi:hypothetical protein